MAKGVHGCLSRWLLYECLCVLYVQVETAGSNIEYRDRARCAFKRIQCCWKPRRLALVGMVARAPISYRFHLLLMSGLHGDNSVGRETRNEDERACIGYNKSDTRAFRVIAFARHSMMKSPLKRAAVGHPRRRRHCLRRRFSFAIHPRALTAYRFYCAACL